jgi:stringent starvation protein B
VSSTPTFGAPPGTATRPYLIRALHEWCTDNGFTPYIAVFVDRSVQVPTEYVKANEIVLNVGFEATSGLKLGNDTIEFKARFGGTAREIRVPVDHVIAIYARENGQGMAFPVPTAEATAEVHPITVPLTVAPQGGAADSGRSTAQTEGAAAPSARAASPGAPAAAGVPRRPEDPSEPPPEPSPSAGSRRPSLKRIK